MYLFFRGKFVEFYVFDLCVTFLCLDMRCHTRTKRFHAMNADWNSPIKGLSSATNTPTNNWEGEASPAGNVARLLGVAVPNRSIFEFTRVKSRTDVGFAGKRLLMAVH